MSLVYDADRVYVVAVSGLEPHHSITISLWADGPERAMTLARSAAEARYGWPFRSLTARVVAHEGREITPG